MKCNSSSTKGASMRTDRSTFEVSGSHFNGPYETSEGYAVDCTGRDGIKITSYTCNCDDVREWTHHIAVVSGNKDSIKEAEERLEHALYQVQDYGQWKIHPTAEDYWYWAPMHLEMVQYQEVDQAEDEQAEQDRYERSFERGIYEQEMRYEE